MSRQHKPLDQITAKDFWDYEGIRVQGRHNMLMESGLAQQAAGLDAETYFAVMNYYTELKRRFNTPPEPDYPNGDPETFYNERAERMP